MRKFNKRLQQSRNDTQLVKVVYRLKGDSKDRVMLVQQCKLIELKRSMRTTIWKVQTP